MAVKQQKKSPTVPPSPPPTADGAPDTLSEQYGGSAPGWVCLLPDSWAPFIRLARLSPPAALCLIYFPHLFGLLHTARRLGRDPFALEDARLYALLLGGSFFFSNAAHAWNDLVDAPIDRQVARTKNRPVANGTVSPRAAFLFTASQAVGAAAFLPFLSWPSAAVATLPTIVGTAYYPFAKRHTYFSQVILGFCLAWGIVVGSAAAGLEEPWRDQGTLCLVAASILWTVIYDTVYAHQDIKDDTRVGTKSMAMLFSTDTGTKSMLWFVWCLMGAALVTYARVEGMGLIFCVITIFGSLSSLGAMISKVELGNQASCWWWFSVGFWYVGLSFTGGLLVDHWLKVGGLVW